MKMPDAKRIAPMANGVSPPAARTAAEAQLAEHAKYTNQDGIENPVKKKRGPILIVLFVPSSINVS